MILRYHAVTDAATDLAAVLPRSICHTAAEFASHMELIAREYNPITIEDIVDPVANCARNLPRRSVIVSFDDGYKNNATIAAPTMAGLGIRGVFYVVVGAIESDTLPWFCRTFYAFQTTERKHWTDKETGTQYRLDSTEERNSARLAINRRCARSIGSEQASLVDELEGQLAVSLDYSPLMMDWDEIRRLRGNGHQIGAHTMSHPNLALLPKIDVEVELQECKSRLESELSENVVHFSYPNPIVQPHWNQVTIEATRQAGFRSAVTSTSGAVQSSSDPLCLQRIAAPNTADELRWRLDLAFCGGIS